MRPEEGKNGATPRASAAVVFQPRFCAPSRIETNAPAGQTHGGLVP